MNAPSLSLLITNTPYLSDQHLFYQIQALNQQSNSDFEVHYFNQTPNPGLLQQQLQSLAHFRYQIWHLPYPYLQGVCCWDLVQPVGNWLAQAAQGKWFSYLHKECLPHPHFVAHLLQGLQAAEASYGERFIARLNQLRCPLPVEQLGPAWENQLQANPGTGWSSRIARQPQPDLFSLQPWQEDAFAMPTALARRENLFSCITQPLFFQDLFDLLLQLGDKPYLADLTWLHLHQPVIYHLNHPRIFLEYTQAFLAQVRAQPSLFKHLALYQLAHSDFDYHEPFDGQQRQLNTSLFAFVQYMRYSEKGTMTLWNQALDALHSG